jgi:hypothetical protein
MQELSLLTTEKTKMFAWCLFFHIKNIKEKKKARRERCAFAGHFRKLYAGEMFATNMPPRKNRGGPAGRFHVETRKKTNGKNRDG